LRRPEWCDHGLTDDFANWFRSVLPFADQVFTVSDATAGDVVAWMRERGLSLANQVKPVSMGTGLSHEIDLTNANLRLRPDLPPPGSYVLFVSTLEARKNHALLFRVWRRLLSELPREQIPTLVFAGRVGWLVADLIQQLENTNWLDGKIRLLRDPTDAELLALYRGCQFTVFPSLFEGWGLPVSESLALGRPCIASNRTSLPEVGGALARYFDPENLNDAYRVVRDVIEHPVELEAWRERVAREFRHVPWDCTADAILAACPPSVAPTYGLSLPEKTT
jgi:glycosyltransferase involved in cell wall biosynthesis